MRATTYLFYNTLTGEITKEVLCLPSDVCLQFRDANEDYIEGQADQVTQRINPQTKQVIAKDENDQF